MTEKQPVRLDEQSIIPSKEGVKPFGGFAIHGVFMGPNPELTDTQQENLQDKIKNIQQHLN